MQISNGYLPGIVGDITSLHARYYARVHGFGAEFESKVAFGLAEFVQRLGNPVNQIWFIGSSGNISASLAIDGEDLGNGVAHLRWFVVSDDLRGKGAGRKLLGEALNFCDQRNFTACDLWTFEGLDAARHLYETCGFVLQEEWDGDQWGVVVREQRFRRNNAA